jgi:flagellar biogenesis protein FliO
MSTKIIASEQANFTDALPLTQHLRNMLRALLARFTRTTNSTERALTVEDRVALGPKKSLAVVNCHGQRFLIAVAGETIGPIIAVSSQKTSCHSRAEREA